MENFKLGEGLVMLEKLHEQTNVLLTQEALHALESYLRVAVVGAGCSIAKEGDAVVVNPVYMNQGVPVYDVLTGKSYFVLPEKAISLWYMGPLKKYYLDKCTMSTKEAMNKLGIQSKIADMIQGRA